MSREKILRKIRENQPAESPLPDLTDLGTEDYGLEKFKNVLESIGGSWIEVADYQQIKDYIHQRYQPTQRIISTISVLGYDDFQQAMPHSLSDVELAIFNGKFGVAENAAIWITEENTHLRVAPFITQHLGIVLATKNIVPTMHQAYQKIEGSHYGFGTFLAGPSKTADIEQSLVLGAHGARSLIVFLMN